MLDPKFIRENLELVREGAKKKNVNVDIDAWIALDDKRKKLHQEFSEIKAEQNKASAEIGKASPDQRAAMIAKV